jgi:hypothetical protein
MRRVMTQVMVLVGALAVPAVALAAGKVAEVVCSCCACCPGCC